MYQRILSFWFEDIDPALWWAKNDAFDQRVREQFSDLYEQAIRCELFAWRQHPEGRLAEIIILDQFSRNLFRGSALAFAQDSLALALAQEAIAAGADQQLNPIHQCFLYMPFMHSESLLIHEIAMDLFQQTGSKANVEFEKKHVEILKRFGRYPHRNALLGRDSTEAELEFLTQPNSGF